MVICKRWQGGDFLFPAFHHFTLRKFVATLELSKSSGCANRMGLLSSSKIEPLQYECGSKLKMIDTHLKIGMQQIMTPNLPRCWYPNFVIQKQKKTFGSLANFWLNLWSGRSWANQCHPEVGRQKCTKSSWNPKCVLEGSRLNIEDKAK